jgi:signal transduction histidine kinase
MIPTRYFIDGIISTKYFKYYPKGGPIYIIFLLFFLVLIVLGFVKLIKAFNVSSGTRRNQILYVILASVVGFGGGVLWFLPAFGFDIYPFGIFIVPIYLFIAAYAILRHNLLDINIVLRRRVGHSLLLMMGLAEAKKDPVRFESLAGAGILAAAIAHEIKNPLTAIKGMVQSLPGNLADREFMENFNDIVPRQIEKINTSVERLLRSIKGSSAKRDKANVEEFSSEEIIDDILFLIRMQCEKHGIVIEKTAYDPARIRADKDLIAQAFFNIIMNAVQAMPCGGDLRVNISRNTVEISDTGQGIKKEHIGRIFEPFFSEKEGGTGIGLPIAAGIIEGAGGKISVESTEGKGSRFKIEF